MRSKCLRKPDRKNTEGHPTLLSRWYTDEEYMKSLSDIGRRDHHIILYDRIALETHIYKATRAERVQIANDWVPFANAEGRKSQITQSTTRLCSSEKENANDCMTSTWQGPKKNTEIFLAVNK